MAGPSSGGRVSAPVARDARSLEQAFMPMKLGDFCTTDLAAATPEERIEYLIMRTRMIRDRSETPEAAEYFDGIEQAFLDSFHTITPEVLSDPEQLNYVQCVDKHTDQQLEALRIPEAQRTRLPGGLGWFDITGTMDDWVWPRVFNEEVVAGMHRNCGGFAIKGAFYAGDQAMYRERAETTAKQRFMEAAAIMGAHYLREQRGQVDERVADILANWGGPRLIISTDRSGTAEPFVTPKVVSRTSVREHFDTHEIVTGVEGVIERMLAERA